MFYVVEVEWIDASGSAYAHFCYLSKKKYGKISIQLFILCEEERKTTSSSIDEKSKKAEQLFFIVHR